MVLMMEAVIGALVGAGIGAGVTWLMAAKQQRHEREMAAAARLRDRVAALLTASTELAGAAATGDAISVRRLFEFQSAAALVMAECGPSEDGLRTFAKLPYLEISRIAATDQGRSRKGAELSPNDLKEVAQLAGRTRDGLLGWLSGEGLPDSLKW